MEKHTPYEKLQRKKQRQIAAKRRGSWGAISPVTRKSKNKKVYDRNKSRQRRNDDAGICYIFIRDVIKR